MKLTKIARVPLEVCSGEQKIAYNLLSSYYDFENKKTALQLMGGVLDRMNTRVNKQVTKELIIKNYDSYKALKYHLMTSYREIGEAIRL